MPLQPFFGYFGGKWRYAKFYQEPMHDTIIEPFAGSAGYGVRYARNKYGDKRRVHLNDLNPIIANVWEYLIWSGGFAAAPKLVARTQAEKDVRAEAIRALPDNIADFPDFIVPGHLNRNDPAVQKWEQRMINGRKSLAGFWYAKGSATPRMTKTPWMTQHPDSTWWGDGIRDRLIRQLDSLEHFRVSCVDYWDLDPDGKQKNVTWFIDPPYQYHGSGYPFGSREFDYKRLREWVLARHHTNQVILCEGGNADWMRGARGPEDDFRPFLAGKRSTGQDSGVGAKEVVWYKDWPEKMHNSDNAIDIVSEAEARDKFKLAL